MITTVVLIVVAQLVLLTQISYAGNGTVTPYGDYCVDLTVYGACKVILTPDNARRVLEKYYSNKGLRVAAVHERGRFMEADIFKDATRVDRVLFDRKTGRLRSIY